jgi:hypothetical protein
VVAIVLKPDIGTRQAGLDRRTRVTMQRAKGNTRASTIEPAAKAVKVFTSIGELERKRKAEDSTTEQVAQLKELVYRLLKS